MWDALGADVDLLIIGGGINGAGIARDAARRGLSVALVEMKDLAYGTSSRSSKLVHGGLRYLENFEFGLVFEAVSERRILLDIAPHMVNPLGFLFPVYKESRRGLATVGAGMWLYEGLSLFRSPKRHRRLSADDIAREEPTVRQEHLKGAQLYYDCSTDDARLTLESALDAVAQGAVISTWTKAVEFSKDDAGRITGATVEDVFTGKTKEIRAHAVVNATGPWTDHTISMVEEGKKPLLRPTKGVHAVVPHDALPVSNAVVCFHPEDRRVLFAIPWHDRTYLGTTDTDYRGDPGACVANGSDIQYLIQAANYYFPKHQISSDDIISTWAGLRPLIAEGTGDALDESQVSREHKIVIGRQGLITIAGGKLTTYRRMSQEVVETVLKLLRLSNKLPEGLEVPGTDTNPLPGADGWPPDDDHERVASEVLAAAGPGTIDLDIARNLANTYGMLGLEIGAWLKADPSLAEPLIEGRPEILAQVDWGVQRELAATATDIMIQRTQLFYRDLDQGLGCVGRVAERMGEILGWSPEIVRRNVAQYEHDVQLSRQWRETL